MILAAESLALRPTIEDDLDFVLREEGNEENRPFIGRWLRARHLEALADPDAEHLILARDGSPVGYAILTGLDAPGAVICIKRLTVAEKGRGHGRAALRLIKGGPSGRSAPTASGSTSKKGTGARGISTSRRVLFRRAS